MKVYLTGDAWDDYRYWIKNNQDMLERVNLLIEDARRRLFIGLGKPEPLKGDFAGWWSRRINGSHRLVYRIEGRPGADQHIEIAACHYHYR